MNSAKKENRSCFTLGSTASHVYGTLKQRGHYQNAFHQHPQSWKLGTNWWARLDKHTHLNQTWKQAIQWNVQ